MTPYHLDVWSRKENTTNSGKFQYYYKALLKCACKQIKIDFLRNAATIRNQPITVFHTKNQTLTLRH